MPRFPGIVLFCAFFVPSVAQDYNFKRYRVENGLPSGIVKACVQDSLGYFWIATDEGLAKYDGVKFTAYRRSTHSNYMKGFLVTRSGKLLAYGDLDLFEIRNLGDEVLFKSLAPVARNPVRDSTLSYPKLLYEDFAGNIWVSESQSVVVMRNGKMKRFNFNLTDRTPQFIRSFSFFEDEKHNFFSVSYKGNIFQYNKSTDAFEPYAKHLPHNVEHVSVINGQLIVGAAEGLFAADLLPAGGFGDLKLKLDNKDVSFVTPLPHQKVFVATRGNQHYIGDLKREEFSEIALPINDVNHVYLSRENDLWISGNDGWIRMQENLFQTISNRRDAYIEAIAEDTVRNKIYYATRSTLYCYDKAKKEDSEVMSIDNGYFQSILITDQGIWVANAFQVLLLEDKKVKRRYDFSSDRRFVTQLRMGLSGNIWLTIPGSASVYRIKPDFELDGFKIPLGKEDVINLVGAGSNGIYLGAGGDTTYLYFKAVDEPRFKNISAPLPFAVDGDFNVTDMAFIGDDIWLATSAGLLQYSHGKIRRLDLGSSFYNQPVKAVKAYAPNKLLLTNAFGVILFDTQTGAHDLFNESSGLPSNAIGPRSLFVSRDHEVWVGTSRGVCYTSDMLANHLQTPPVRFVETRIDGKPSSVANGATIDYGSFLSFMVSSITFPENELSVQYRVSPDTLWQTSANLEITLSRLPIGEHTLEVKAKKSGPYGWSEVSTKIFVVGKPFWLEWWFIALGTLGMAILLTASFILAQARIRRMNRALQRLVDERTTELKSSNEQLLALNEEKNNLIGIVAHDLKSPLNQVQGLISIIKMSGDIDEMSAQCIDKMNDSVEHLNQMITKILDVNAIESSQINMTIEPVNIAAILNGVAERYTPDAARKAIRITRNIDGNTLVLADKEYIEQVLENLISNAIKFSPHEREVTVSLKATDSLAICEVRDQGPGLSEEDKKSLFGRYQRLSARPTGDENSTGLGLSIARKFVREMKGDIWCESEWGKGASFFVSFRKVS